MATNIYDFDERVHFDPCNPTVYFGWYISTTSSELKVAHFRRPELRTAMAGEVQALFPNSKNDAELLAACALIRSFGGDTGDSEFAESIATDILSNDPDYEKGGEKWDALCEIGDKYAENYE